jgi:metallo-beta-lactamase class B
MRRLIALVWLALSLLVVRAAAAVPASHPDAEHARSVPAFKIFDNLYFIGNDFVSAYLVPTEQGLIMIDALYGEFTSEAIASVRKLGFDPRQIKYVLCTHAHWDHVGGASTVRALTGARIGMTTADWDLLERDRRAGRLRFEAPARDLVIKDGDVLTLGRTRVKFYVTPGHTPGVLSMELIVVDAERSYRAFMFGGVGLNFDGVQRTEQYLASVRRIRALGTIDVNLPNHPFVSNVLQRAERLLERPHGAPHPFVAPAEFQSWLNELESNAQRKLKEEKKRAAAKQSAPP